MGRHRLPHEAALARGHAPTQSAQRRGLAALQALGARPAAGRIARALRERGVRDVRRGPRVATRENPAGMTARELEVLVLVAEGLRNAEIAQRLFVSEKTVGHHVSAIVIQAQAGRIVAATHPDRAAAALATIEEAASRMLEEMRAMVGVLRDGAEPDFAPQPAVGDIQRLARGVGGWPRVDVRVSGDFAELNPAVGGALYRIAQESVTNAMRHARDATRITVQIADESEQVRLTVRDDGDITTAHASAGYGIVGMTERANLLGGTLRAGGGAGGGWIVEAVLPKRSAS